MIQTSITHPLRIDTLEVANGYIGLTLAPGKCAPSDFGGTWRRDLDIDLAAIRDWGAAVVVTALTLPEIAAIGTPDLGARLAALGIEWLHLPIEDGAKPGADWWDAWQLASPRLHRHLERGDRVLIHCRGGLERAPMIATLMMMERGVPIGEASDRIAVVRPGASPLPVQTAALIRALPPISTRARQVRAMLRAGALGDAMGAEIEFWSLDAIRNRFPDGIDRLLPHQGLTGAVTDDTQMVLFTAEGLIRATIRSMQGGICVPAAVVHHALLRWYVTQGTTPKIAICDRGLVEDPRLHAVRAPGNTCLSGLSQARRFGDPARNGSKGCGTIMRVAPVALWHGYDVRQIALDTSALTHGHPTAAEAAACFVDVLRAVAAGASIEAAARVAFEATNGETRDALRAALDARRDGAPETVEQLGGGWTAEEALAIAVYAALCATSLDHGLQIALVHSGDSDSTAAIAGNLLGLMFPDQVMTHPLQDKVECADLIERLARDLATFAEVVADITPRMYAAYPCW